MIRILIKRRQVVEDIEALIHKAMDVLDPAQAKSYFVRADRSDLDSGIIKRMLDSRDADVRTMLEKYVQDLPVYLYDFKGGEYESRFASDDLDLEQEDYFYPLDMPKEWNKALTKPLAQNIHDYLVNGVLHDWYLKNMPEMVNTIDYQRYIDNIKSIINRRTGFIKRPLRPF